MMPADEKRRPSLLTVLRRLLVVALVLAASPSLVPAQVKAAPTPLLSSVLQPVQYYGGGYYYGRPRFYRPYYRPRFYGPRFYGPRPYYRHYYHRYYRPY